MFAGIVCVPLPLKLTVLGIAAVTFNTPAVMVKAPAMPSTEFVDNIKAVPLIFALNRLAIPFRVAEPVNVAIPAVALKLPLISRALDTEKLDTVVTVPVINKP